MAMNIVEVPEDFPEAFVPHVAGLVADYQRKVFCNCCAEVTIHETPDHCGSVTIRHHPACFTYRRN